MAGLWLGMVLTLTVAWSKMPTLPPTLPPLRVALPLRSEKTRTNTVLTPF